MSDLGILCICVTLCSIVGVLRTFPWASLRKPDPEGWKETVSLLRDDVRRIEGLHYDVETAMKRMVREREDEKSQFEIRMKRVEEERDRLAAIASMRVPHARMG